MEKKEIQELKGAILSMETVAKTLPYHNKLKKAWGDLKKALEPVFVEKQAEQKDLFE